MAGAGITLAQVIQSFSQEVGRSADDPSLLDDIAEAIEFVLHSGGGEILREWKIPIHNGTVTLPRDLETPIKYKWGRLANSGFGIFMSPYLSYSSEGVMNFLGYENWDTKLSTRARRVPIQFKIPRCGVQVVATSRNPKDVGKTIIISGNQNGRQIAPTHFGQKTAGEVLKIYDVDDPKKKYSSYLFHEITGIVKDPTLDYIFLSGKAPGEDVPSYILSCYHPDEEVPSYTQIEMFSTNAYMLQSDCDTWIHILGRINPSLKYTREDDIVPITSHQMLKLLAKRYKYDYSNEFDLVERMEQRILRLIRKQKAYQQPPGRTASRNLRRGNNRVGNY